MTYIAFLEELYFCFSLFFSSVHFLLLWLVCFVFPLFHISASIFSLIQAASRFFRLSGLISVSILAGIHLSSMYIHLYLHICACVSICPTQRIISLYVSHHLSDSEPSVLFSCFAKSLFSLISPLHPSPSSLCLCSCRV